MVAVGVESEVAVGEGGIVGVNVGSGEGCAVAEACTGVTTCADSFVGEAQPIKKTKRRSNRIDLVILSLPMAHLLKRQ